MQRKQLAFEQLFDVRAVRVVVASLAACYGALGVVHGRWPYVPGEFDDYIATPKGNGYRSIHTAVIGPQARSVEVQIRTREMHEHAELGVAAHWTYKEGGAADAQYQRKIEWVRRLLEPADGRQQRRGRRSRSHRGHAQRAVRGPRLRTHAQGRGDRSAARRHPARFRLQRAYLARTPLPRCQGQRPHRAANPRARQRRGAWRSSPASTKRRAATGSRPSRASWPRHATAARYAPGSGGRTWATIAVPARGSPSASWRASACCPAQLPALAAELKARDVDHLHQLLGEGEITVTQLMHAANRLFEPAPPPRRAAPGRGAPPRQCRWRSKAWAICRRRWRAAARRCGRSRSPATSTLGRGVTVHRSDCPSLIRMAALKARSRAAGRMERRRCRCPHASNSPSAPMTGAGCCAT